MSIVHNDQVTRHGIINPYKALEFPCFIMVTHIWTSPDRARHEEEIGFVESGFFLPSNHTVPFGAVRGLSKEMVAARYIFDDLEQVKRAAHRYFSERKQCATLVTVDMKSLLEMYYGNWRLQLNFNFWMPANEEGFSGMTLQRAIPR